MVKKPGMFSKYTRAARLSVYGVNATVSHGASGYSCGLSYPLKSNEGGSSSAVWFLYASLNARFVFDSAMRVFTCLTFERRTLASCSFGSNVGAAGSGADIVRARAGAREEVSRAAAVKTLTLREKRLQDNDLARRRRQDARTPPARPPARRPRRVASYRSRTYHPRAMYAAAAVATATAPPPPRARRARRVQTTRVASSSSSSSSSLRARRVVVVARATPPPGDDAPAPSFSSDPGAETANDAVRLAKQVNDAVDDRDRCARARDIEAAASRAEASRAEELRKDLEEAVRDADAGRYPKRARAPGRVDPTDAMAPPATPPPPPLTSSSDDEEEGPALVAPPPPREDDAPRWVGEATAEGEPAAAAAAAAEEEEVPPDPDPPNPPTISTEEIAAIISEFEETMQIHDAVLDASLKKMAEQEDASEAPATAPAPAPKKSERREKIEEKIRESRGRLEKEADAYADAALAATIKFAEGADAPDVHTPPGYPIPTPDRAFLSGESGHRTHVATPVDAEARSMYLHWSPYDRVRVVNFIP